MGKHGDAQRVPVNLNSFMVSSTSCVDILMSPKESSCSLVPAISYGKAAPMLSEKRLNIFTGVNFQIIYAGTQLYFMLVFLNGSGIVAGEICGHAWQFPSLEPVTDIKHMFFLKLDVFTFSFSNY